MEPGIHRTVRETQVMVLATIVSLCTSGRPETHEMRRKTGVDRIIRLKMQIKFNPQPTSDPRTASAAIIVSAAIIASVRIMQEWALAMDRILDRALVPQLAQGETTTPIINMETIITNSPKTITDRHRGIINSRPTTAHHRDSKTQV